MSMSSLLHILNTFHLDARRYINDQNRVILTPQWVNTTDTNIDQTNESLKEENKTLKYTIKELTGRISNLNVTVDKLQKENAAYRSALESPSNTRGSISSPMTLSNNYVFHKLLWKSLPSVLDMTSRDFCKAIGLDEGTYASSPNPQLEWIVNACNEFRISITHFFPPKGTPLIVNSKHSYQIPTRKFKPIKVNIENFEYLFGNKSVINTTIDDVRKACNISYTLYYNMIGKNGNSMARALTIADICSSFNIPPCIFFQDENTKQGNQAYGRNVQLLENCIAMAKKMDKLKKKLKEQ